MARPEDWYLDLEPGDVSPWPGRLADARSFAQALGPATRVVRTVHGVTVPFLVQEPLPGWVHPCTVDDVAVLLGQLDARLVTGWPMARGGSVPDGAAVADATVAGLVGVVLWQPDADAGPHTASGAPGSRQQSAPVWARVVHHADIADRPGPVLLVAAQSLPMRLAFRRRLDPDLAHEVDALQMEASCTAYGARSNELLFDADAARRVLLHRAVPVEMAHLMAFAERVAVPGAATEAAWLAACEQYLAPSADERERDARAHAEAVTADLRAAGALPVGRRLDPAALAADELPMHYFLPPAEA